MKTQNLTAKAKIMIRRKPEEVFSAIVNAETMSKFWFTRQDDGLKAGETFTWFLGSGEDAYSFQIKVKELVFPSRLIFESENGGDITQVEWKIKETEIGNSILEIEESGFSGNNERIIEGALNSTGGFNQVIVALKAVVENDVVLNVVADHV